MMVCVTMPKVKWIALYPPQSEGARWTYNVALEGEIGCGDLAETASDAPVEQAMADFRQVLRDHFDAPDAFDFQAGDRSWGATFTSA